MERDLGSNLAKKVKRAPRLGWDSNWRSEERWRRVKGCIRSREVGTCEKVCLCVSVHEAKWSELGLGIKLMIWKYFRSFEKRLYRD